MSGSGKSHWSKRLAYEMGFQNFYCDDLIEQKLSKILPATIPAGIGRVAEWLGQPFEATFQEREMQYLDCEIQVMQEVLSYLEMGQSKQVVIDTSGSVIYTGENICEALKSHSKVVYLRISKNDEVKLLEQFLRDPKPVLWNSLFAPLPGESNKDAVSRCYPVLLEDRKKRYETMAHAVIDVSMDDRAKLTTKDFISLLA